MLIKAAQYTGNSGNKWYTSWHFTHRVIHPLNLREKRLFSRVLQSEKSVVKLSASAECEGLWRTWANMKQTLVHSNTRPTSSLCWVTLHIYTKREGYLQPWSGKLWVTLKSTSFWKLQLYWTQQVNWKNWKLNKHRHVGCEIWSAVEAFCSRKGRNFFFFLKASHSAI